MNSLPAREKRMGRSIKKHYKAYQKYASFGAIHSKGLLCLIDAEQQACIDDALAKYNDAIDALRVFEKPNCSYGE